MENINMISTKDLDYICDIFNWNLNIYKTCSEMESKITDMNLKEIISDMKLMHKESCEEILGVLNNG